MDTFPDVRVDVFIDGWMHAWVHGSMATEELVSADWREEETKERKTEEKIKNPKRNVRQQQGKRNPKP